MSRTVKYFIFSSFFLGSFFLSANNASTLESLTKKIEAQAKEIKALKEQKYGVINLRQIVMTVEDGVKAQKSLKEEVAAVEKTLMKRQEELTEMQKKLADPMVSGPAKERTKKLLEQKYMAFKQEEMKFKSEIQMKEQEAFQSISSKVAKLIEFEAEKRNLPFVFHEEGLAFADSSSLVNLTGPLIETYNKLKEKKVIASKEKKK